MNAPFLRRVLLAALIAGTLDIVYAMAWNGYRGMPPVQTLQSVASGLLSKGAFDGGAGTAALGLALHFGIMSVAAALYALASVRVLVLERRWLLCGTLFGVAFYLVMNHVVTPLSAIGRPVYVGFESVVRNLIAHVLFSGLPIAYIISRKPRGR